MGTKLWIWNKWKAYVVFMAFFFLLAGLFQFVWLFSCTTTGYVRSFEKGLYGPSHSIDFVNIHYKVDGVAFHETYFRNSLPDNADSPQVRYLIFAPSVSRLDNLSGNWGLVLSCFLVYFLILSIIFLRKDIIPPGCRIKIALHWPFLEVLGGPVSMD